MDFTDTPILIGGQALQLYKIRKSGNDTDFIISKRDYVRLSKIHPPFDKFPPNTPGIKIKNGGVETDYFLHINGLDYRYFVKNAHKKGKHLLASIPDLIVLKAITGFYEDKKFDLIPDPKARKKSFDDLGLLVASLGVFAPKI